MTLINESTLPTNDVAIKSMATKDAYIQFSTQDLLIGAVLLSSAFFWLASLALPAIKHGDDVGGASCLAMSFVLSLQTPQGDSASETVFLSRIAVFLHFLLFLSPLFCLIKRPRRWMALLAGSTLVLGCWFWLLVAASRFESTYIGFQLWSYSYGLAGSGLLLKGFFVGRDAGEKRHTQANAKQSKTNGTQPTEQE